MIYDHLMHCLYWLNQGKQKRRFVLEPGFCELLQLSGNKLRHLAIGVNGLTGEGLASLQLIFPNLEHLSIDFGKKLGENGLRSLLQMPGALLKFLYFGLIKFSQFDLSWLAGLKFPRLESIVIENCRHLDRSRLLGYRSITLDRIFYRKRCMILSFIRVMKSYYSRIIFLDYKLFYNV